MLIRAVIVHHPQLHLHVGQMLVGRKMSLVIGQVNHLLAVGRNMAEPVVHLVEGHLGLFGAVSIILVFLFVIYRCMVIANDAPDMYGSILVVGVMAQIAMQVIFNIAVVTNSMPNTGVTLPFISAGGTSILFLMVEMGIVLSVAHTIRLN